MSLLAAIRHRQHRASRLVAVIFAIGWLGFAAAPCQASPVHESTPADDCADCLTMPAGLVNDCATVAAPDCLSEGLELLKQRDTELPQPSAGLLSALPISLAFIADCGTLRDTRARWIPVSRVSIQQRYCTYQF